MGCGHRPREADGVRRRSGGEEHYVTWRLAPVRSVIERNDSVSADST